MLKDEAIEGLLGKDHPKTRFLLKGGKTTAVEVRAVTRAQAKDQAQKRDEDRVADARDGAQPNPPSVVAPLVDTPPSMPVPPVVNVDVDNGAVDVNSGTSP